MVGVDFSHSLGTVENFQLHFAPFFFFINLFFNHLMGIPVEKKNRESNSIFWYLFLLKNKHTIELVIVNWDSMGYQRRAVGFPFLSRSTSQKNNQQHNNIDERERMR